MKPSSKNIYLIVTCLLSLAAGVVARKIFDKPVTSSSDVSRAVTHRSSSRAADDLPSAEKMKAATFHPSNLHSNDTLESIIKVPLSDAYSRLALWLVDASDEDVAAYWKFYEAQKNRPSDLTDLFFVNWVRINRDAAFAAVSGTKYEKYAWRGWCSSDPNAAFQAMKSADKKFSEHIMSSIGEFHPEWVHAHINELNDSEKQMAFYGINHWGNDADPLATLKYYQENKMQIDKNILRALVRKDPWAAYDYMKSEGNLVNKYQNQIEKKNILEMLAGEHPDDVARMAELAPKGELRREMEAVIFKNLITTNPEEALEQARKTEAPSVAAQYWIDLIAHYTTENPDKALSLLEEFWKNHPNGFAIGSKHEFDKSTYSGSSKMDGLNEMLASIVARKPQETAELAFNTKSAHPDIILRQWLKNDPEAYSNWVNQQTDQERKSAGASIIVSHLISEESNFPLAAQWITMLKNEQQFGHGFELYSNWKKSDSNAADQWLDHSGLAEEHINRIKQFYNSNQHD